MSMLLFLHRTMPLDWFCIRTNDHLRCSNSLLCSISVLDNEDAFSRKLEFDTGESEIF